jgi:hypothetical protein
LVVNGAPMAEMGVTEETQIPAARWSERRPRRAVLAYVAAYAAAAAAGGVLVLVPMPRPVLVVLVTVIGTVATALSLLFVLSLCRVRLTARAEAALLFPTTIVFLLARPEVTIRLAFVLRVPPKLLMASAPLFVWRGQDLVGNIALILWAVLIGRLVSRIIKEGKLLLPVAIVASLVDIFTVFWGFVGKVVDKAPAVGQAFSAQAPAVAVAEKVNAPVLTYIGMGDFLFIAMFLSVALRHAMPAGRAMWAAFVSMLAAAAVLALWNPPGIPGLPFISAAVLLVTRRHFVFTREEKRALVVAGVVVAAVAGMVGAMLVHAHGGKGPGVRGQGRAAAPPERGERGKVRSDNGLGAGAPPLAEKGSGRTRGKAGK